MSSTEPIQKSKEDYIEIIEKIRSESPVGIDAQLTHAMIIDYLKRLTQQLDRIEKRLE
jgi:hypothetical protein